MLRHTARISLRAVPSRASLRLVAPKRHVSTAPPSQKSGTWKAAALRWGLAGAGVYYYNTSSIFAEEPAFGGALSLTPAEQTEQYPTLEEVAAERRHKKSISQSASSSLAPETRIHTVPDGEEVASGSPQELEEEADQQGAFNPETGEINWDCSCLGGMAHGPCGPEFREAFSCFVYSKEEPKGVDCIEKFKGMQDCFRRFPDVYGEELADGEDDAPGEPEGIEAPAPAAVAVSTNAEVPSLTNLESTGSESKKITEQKAPVPDNVGTEAAAVPTT